MDFRPKATLWMTMEKGEEKDGKKSWNDVCSG